MSADGHDRRRDLVTGRAHRSSWQPADWPAVRRVWCPGCRIFYLTTSVGRPCIAAGCGARVEIVLEEARP